MQRITVLLRSAKEYFILVSERIWALNLCFLVGLQKMILKKSHYEILFGT